ncbi:hypothetical protein OGAPHI_007244 [Ogataea philodendri]|uniref:Uncharacterized protein n=1 Tax=Ogataea philodendri TaxID=1378263 RepID=A0A9P8NV86_9ASCO|nr:uncharacterized protein OGAPHI_007244 [Ogataea philodendri]KAH3660039.1 hypothetical protein OGAPHI_007244 [Ogataea philodendri]
MGLQNVDGLDRVFGLALAVGGLDSQDGINHHLTEKVRVRSNDLGRHGRLCNIHKGFLSERVNGLRKHLVDESGRLLQRQTVSSDHGCWVDLIFHQLVGSLQEFGGNDHNRSGSVTDFTILLISQLHQNLSSRMLHVQKGQDGRAVVGNRDITNIVDEHFVKSHWTQGRFHHIGNGLGCQHVLVTHVIATELFSAQKQGVRTRCREH